MKLIRKTLAFCVVALVIAAMTIGLVACNRQEDYQKHLENKGYAVKELDASELPFDIVSDYEWAIYAEKGGSIYGGSDVAIVIKYKSEDDAKATIDSFNKHYSGHDGAIGSDTENYHHNIAIMGFGEGSEDARLYK